MADFFRTLCVVSCLASGIYTFVVYYFSHNARKTLWYTLFCIMYAVNVNLRFAIFPSEILNSSFYGELAANFFLTSYAMAVLCLNVYAGTAMKQNLFKYHNVYNYILMLVAAFSMLAGSSLIVIFFFVITAFALTTYIFGLKVSLKRARKGEHAMIYPCLISIIMIAATVFDGIMMFTDLGFVSVRCIMTPIVLAFHALTLTVEYRNSLKKTQRLSSSLEETLERIKHSDNALMCTQMKADFLYRSLDLISQRCDEDPFTAEDLTISLSKYLRHTLNFQQLQGIVPLSNEIELTKSYIAIEKERHPDITFEYHFPNPLPEFHIPPLSIQPLVENAIEHGLAGRESGAKIAITIIPYKDYYHIDVSDNGLGMDEELADSLTDALHETARVGIYNIHTRLIGLFGKGLVIQSAPGIGTSVSFVVPPDAESIIAGKEQK